MRPRFISWGKSQWTGHSGAGSGWPVFLHPPLKLAPERSAGIHSRRKTAEGIPEPLCWKLLTFLNNGMRLLTG